MYTALIFDFYGVFSGDIATNWFKKTVRDDSAKFAAFQALCSQSDYGQLSRAEFYEAVTKLAGLPISQTKRGIEAELALNTELVDYVKKLKQSYRTACLSNGTHEWTLQVIIDYGLEPLFDEIVLSGDLGMVKPYREIYEHTLTKLGVTADQTIFIDDRQVNVDGAEAVGIKSFVFTDTQTLQKDLEKLGIRV
jgi:HAD superfamily hydrolase (TIGR01509 family)